jgi:hypothetical protein
MGATKARWKRAPRDQRRLAMGRTAPNARFTRRQVSASLPPSLTSRQNRWVKPALLLVTLASMVGLSVALVIAVGAYIRAEQQADEMHERAGYYGLPTQPFSTLAPDQSGQGLTEISTSVAIMTTPIPLTGEIVSGSESATARTEPNDVSSDGSNILSSFCEDFGVPVSLELFDWNDWSTVNLTNALVAQIPMRWDASKTFWRGYDSPKPFDQPDDARSRWQLTLQTEDGAERWIHVWQSVQTPDMLYVYAYQVITPFADVHGEHFGYHPCSAFTVPPADMNILLSSARAYQSSGSRFPAAIPVNDPQWVLGHITPLNSSFEIRGIPTLLNNNPLQTLSTPMPCYFVTHEDWGMWAQIKLGNTIGWVDTSTVTLEASS